MPMVEIHATQFLNLLRGDWLNRPPPAAEIAFVALAAVVVGLGLLYLRPWAATGMAVLGAISVVLLAQSLFFSLHLWFAWLVVVAIQIPCGLLYSIVFRSLEWYAHRRKLEEERHLADLRIREQASLLDKAQDAIIVHDLDWPWPNCNNSDQLLFVCSASGAWGNHLRN